MPDVAKLKKKAAELELKKQFDKALAVYVEILDGFKDSDEEVDVALYNRVGDLYLKQGNVADAVDYYEQAVDRYADGGFFNNAIALCNKILRNSPGRVSIYYKLGKISARKGFVSDAKVNFLEYADRMQKSGKIDEAFRALKEFADLCPDQDDIRLLLAEQLSKQERGPEAIEQLQLLYERYSQQGRELEARATIDRMKAIDPSVQPRSSGSVSTRGGGDLVFLDLDDKATGRNAQILKRATHGLDLIHTGEYQEIAPAPVPAPAVAAAPAPTPELLDTPIIEPALLDGVTRAAEFETSEGTRPTGGGLLDGLQTVSFDAGELASPLDGTGSLLDLEPTDLGAIDTSPRMTPLASPARRGDDAELLDFSIADVPVPERRDSRDDLPMLDDETLDVSSATDEIAIDLGEDESSIGGDLELIMPEADERAADGAAALADIPLMDFSLPTPGEAMASITGDVEQSPSLDFLDLSEPATSANRPESIFGTESELDLPSDAFSQDESIGDDDAFALATDSLDDSGATPTPPAARRSSTMIAEQSVELLQALVDAEPGDYSKRRQLAEAMLDSGDRDGGMRELESAMIGFERGDDLEAASSLADEIVRLNPESVRHHQKRVEYAFRTNERGRLIEAYLALADALFRAGQTEKSRAIYHRVLDLAPDDLRAQAALESMGDEEPEPEPEPLPAARRTTGSSVRIPAAPLTAAPTRTRDDEFVNLGDWLRDDDAPKDTRMVVEEKEPSGDEEADFQEMLRKFKQGKDLTNYAGQSTFNATPFNLHTPVGGALWNEALANGCAGADTTCIRNYIFRNHPTAPGVTRGPDDNGTGNATGTIVGQPNDPIANFKINSFANQKKASLDGIEVNLQHMFGSSGFGISTNYTYVNSGLKYDNARLGEQFALVGLSNSSNVVGIFENDKWTARLAYNWRGEFLSSTFDSYGPNPQYTEAYGQIDLSVGYNVNQNLSLQFEVINAGDSIQRVHGRTRQAVESVTQAGPRYMLGARYKF
ncbi:MAG: TonB-dependent receptor [Duganella sp.]